METTWLGCFNPRNYMSLVKVQCLYDINVELKVLIVHKYTVIDIAQN